MSSNLSSKTISRNEAYVLLGHIAKFVKYGAIRIESNNTRNQDISQVAFKNLDGTIAVVAFNHKDESQVVRFKRGDDSFSCQLEAGMLATFVINK